MPYSAVMLISPQQPHYCHRCQHQHAHHLNHRHNHHLIVTIVIVITIIISIIIIKIIVIRNHFGWNLYRQQTTGRLPWANGLYFLEDGDLARQQRPFPIDDCHRKARIPASTKRTSCTQQSTTLRAFDSTIMLRYELKRSPL